MKEEFYTKDGKSLKDAIQRVERLLTASHLYASEKSIHARLATYDINAIETLLKEVKRTQEG